MKIPSFQFNGSLVFVLLLNFVLHCSYVQWPYLNPDEGVASCVAVEMVHGGMPYIQSVDHRGPVTYCFYSLGFILSHDFEIASIRVVFAFLTTLILWLLYSIISDFNKELATTSMAVFFMFMFYGNVTEYWAFHTEWPLVFFTLLAFKMLRLSLKSRITLYSLLAGISFCLACLSKQIAVFDILACLACSIIGFVWCDFQVSRPIYRLSMIALGGIITFLVVFGGYVAIGGWREFLFYVFEYNLHYYGVVKTPYSNYYDLVDKILNLRLFGPIYFILIGMLILISFQQGKIFLKANFRYLVEWAIYYSIVFIGVRSSGRNFGHYYITLIPALSLAIAFLSNQVSILGVFRLGNLRVWIIFIFIGVAAYVYKFQKNNGLSIRRSVSEFRLDREYDRIFVWGFEPEIYIDLAVRPATRYSFCNFQTGKIPGRKEIMPIVPGSRDSMMVDLNKSMPAYIFDTSPTERFGYEKFPIHSFPELHSFILINYLLLDTMNVSPEWRRYSIYVRKGRD